MRIKRRRRSPTPAPSCPNWITIFFSSYQCIKDPGHTDGNHFAVTVNGKPISWSNR